MGVVVYRALYQPQVAGQRPGSLRELRADPRTGDTPIVVVSADALPQQIDAALAAGCTQYLTKPVSVSEVLQVVDQLLEQVDTRYG